jgi:hypothetical protein
MYLADTCAKQDLTWTATQATDIFFAATHR